MVAGGMAAASEAPRAAEPQNQGQLKRILRGDGFMSGPGVCNTRVLPASPGSTFSTRSLSTSRPGPGMDMPDSARKGFCRGAVISGPAPKAAGVQVHESTVRVPAQAPMQV